MKKNSNGGSKKDDGLDIGPFTREQMRRGVMGKYADSEMVRIAPDLTRAFPTEAVVNQALRELLKFRETLQRITVDKISRRKTA